MKGKRKSNKMIFIVLDITRILEAEAAATQEPTYPA